MGKKYDCIVIGAGPAGSMAAWVLAQNKHKVLLLEKHKAVGQPLSCAEAISYKGFLICEQDNSAWISSRIEKILLVSPSGKELKFSYPKAGLVLNRELFDKELANRAQTFGAELKVNTQAIGLMNNNMGEVSGIRVKEDGKESEYQTKLVIAADGIESLVGRWAGIDNTLKLEEVDSAYQYLLKGAPLENDCIEFHFSTKLAPGGYAWVFPKGKGLANVGLAITPTIGDGTKAKELLDFFVMRRFKSFSVIKWMTGGVPAFTRKSQLVKDNILLTGDAARVVDSLSGAGIANALLSGKIAGQVASEYLSNGADSLDFLKKYEQEFLKIKGRELRFYSFCRKVYLKMRDEDFEEVIQFLKEYLEDKDLTSLTPIQALKEVLRSNPKLLLLLRHLVW
ncbi:MAG TPA: NAD(P)/FAD-dependent oxidoreductase [Terriglobales bacterium]|nr:NAD(P)/FAD-dependent oxidoreductase [Terriglobales bacterium]